MQKSIVVCSFGLLCVLGLTGCGLVKNCRDACDCAAPESRRRAVVVSDGAPISVASSNTNRSKPGLVALRKESVLSKATSTPIVSDAKVPDGDKAIPPLPRPREVVSDDPKAGTATIETLPVEPTKAPVKNAADVVLTPPLLLPKVLELPRTPEQIVSQIPKDAEKGPAIGPLEIVYGQTDNFKVVTGQVTLYRKTWRLRYASVAQEDSHGGVLILEGSVDLSQLRDGSHVRVRGTLVPSDDRNNPARYRVQAIEILD